MVASAAACSTKAAGDDSGSADGGDVVTDVGVTDSTITLGALEDLSGPFKVNGLGTLNGIKVWVDEVNADGGICGRQIELDVKDHGYKPDVAIPIYDEMVQNDLGFVHLLGSSVLAALKPRLANDGVLAVPGSWASSNLDSPSVMLLGQTYDVEAINGLSYLYEQGAIADGDTIGHVYIDSELGQNALLGVQHFADQHDMSISQVAVGATDTDMAATIVKLKEAGATAIVASTSPGALGALAVQNVTAGLNVPIIGNSTTFTLPLMEDPTTASVLTDHFLMVSSFAPIGSDSPAAQKLLAGYQELTDDPPSRDAVGGYVDGMAWSEILTTACEAGDLTRAGVLEAREQVTELDTEGLSGVLDLAAGGAPTTREAMIVKPDAAAPDGLTIVRELEASDAALDYQAPFE